MRHDRQARLAEVGEAGQKRLARASVAVPGNGFAAEVAARYLAGAGVGRLRVATSSLETAARAVDAAVDVVVDRLLDVPGPLSPFEWRDAAAAELANGAYLALQILRNIVEDAQ